MTEYHQSANNRPPAKTAAPANPPPAEPRVLALLSATVLGVAGTGLVILGVFGALLELWWGLPAAASGICAVVAGLWSSRRLGGLAALPGSKTGLASFVLDVISLAAAVVATLAFVHYGRVRTYDGDFLGTDFLVFLIANLVSLSTAIPGVVLGIAGLRREERKSPWAVVGATVSIAILVAWTCWWLSSPNIT